MSWDVWLLIIGAYGLIIGTFIISVIGSAYLVYKNIGKEVIGLMKKRINAFDEMSKNWR